MTKRLTKRQKRERAAARKWARAWSAKAEEAYARARAAEPALAEYDDAWRELDEAIRKTKRFASKNAVVLIALAQPLLPHEPDCGCLRCECVVLDRRLERARLALTELASDETKRAAREAAHERIQERRRPRPPTGETT